MNISLEERRILFRCEPQTDGDAGFDRAAQLRLTAGVLSYLRQTHPDLWNGVHMTCDMGISNEWGHRGVREFKKMLAHLVRCADESSDHLRTVSFVSRSVLQKIRKRSSGGPKLSDLRSKEFLHEHGVPVDAVIRTMVHPRNKNVDLYEFLSAMSCRVLLLRKQGAVIDRGFKSCIAGHVKLGWGSFPIGSLPLRYLALSRYLAADPALIEELVPVSGDAESTLAEFKTLLAESRSGKLECVERMLAEHGANPIAYIPDYVFDWSRAQRQLRPRLKRISSATPFGR